MCTYMGVCVLFGASLRRGVGKPRSVSESMRSRLACGVVDFDCDDGDGAGSDKDHVQQTLVGEREREK